MNNRVFTAFIFFAAAVMTSCSSRKNVITSQISDSIKIEREIEYIERLRDTVIYVMIPQEAKSMETLRDSSYLETSLAESTAKINPDGSLHHTLNNKSRKVPVNLQVSDRISRNTENKRHVSETIREISVKMPLTGLEKFLICSGIILWVLAVTAVMKKIIFKFR